MGQCKTENGSASTAAIAGGVIGGICAVGLIAVILFYLRRKQLAKQKNSAPVREISVKAESTDPLPEKFSGPIKVFKSSQVADTEMPIELRKA